MLETENNQVQNQDQSTTPTSASTESSAPTTPVTPPKEEQTPSEKTYAGKYKTVEDLEKGYKESSKVVRDLNSKLKDIESKIPKAPDKYSFDFSNTPGLEGVKLDEEDPDMKAMVPVFKELGLSQEQASKLVAAHLQNMAALTPTPEQIKEKLGANADVMIGRLQTFTNKLPIEDQKVVQALADTPEGIDFLYRHLVGEELPTPSGSGSSAPAKTAAELKSEAFKYKSDNSRSIGFDKGQQEKYAELMRIALVAEENEKKQKK